VNHRHDGSLDGKAPGRGGRRVRAGIVGQAGGPVNSGPVALGDAMAGVSSPRRGAYMGSLNPVTPRHATTKDRSTGPMSAMTIDELAENFSLFDDWEDRYRYIIDLGKKMEPLPEEAKTAANKVEGCMSQVWLVHDIAGAGAEARLTFRADSDAHIVRGLLAILLILFSGRTAAEIDAIDADAELARLDLDQHISPNRRNGVASVVRTIQTVAKAELGRA
jgi:cysteine desulfuration protein SufE